MHNSNEILVSIITVVFNGEKHLEQTIQSVMNQSYKKIEYIIIDGGSTDGTIEIIEKYKNYISNWISEPDKGLYDAMNKGISMSNGELIGMINSDDWYEPDAVETMLNSYLENPSKTIFHADRYDINEYGNKSIRKFHPSKFKFKYYAMTYNHPSMFVTKYEYQKHKYNPDLKALSDYQFVLEAFLDNSKNLVYINKPIVNYRLEGISAKSSMYESSLEGYIARENAGLNIFQRLGALIFGSSVTCFFFIKNYMRSKILR